MTESRTAAARKDRQLEEALAVLISCTRNRIRPIPLTQIAKWLDIAVAKLGSYAKVADRIGLSAKMLRQFSYVRRLSHDVQQLFEKRKIDSVDAATHLAMLAKSEQQEVADALAVGEIDTIDVRAIVELRKVGNSTSIGRLLRRVKNSKTKQEYVAEFVVRGVRNRDQVLVALQKHIPSSEIVKLELDGAIGRLVLTHKGKQTLRKTARFLQTPLKHVIPTILKT
jgi:cell division protein ZapA (FtsZ GTPase activity inhibitor)